MRYRALTKSEYGDFENTGGEILRPSRQELDLLDTESVKVGLKKTNLMSL